MVARLARYLRFFGHDVEEVRGLPDRSIIERATGSGRTLLTRDRLLASRTRGAILLREHSIGGQLREVRAARPELSFEPCFDRCPRCNARLVGAEPPIIVPVGHRATGRPVRPPERAFRCPDCHQDYWEGSHTARIRELVRAWLGEPVR